MTLLKVDPDDALKFTSGAANGSATLKLTNTQSGNVAFKVKTTAPKSYLVRPSAGNLKSGESIEVKVIVQAQPQGEGPSSNHRFLVQATAVSSDEEASREMWSAVKKELIEEKRLNVIIPEGGAAAPAASAAASPLEAKPSEGGDITAPPKSSQDLKAKYDELVQYTLLLEKEKKKVEESLQAARQGSGSKGGGGGGQYSMAHLLVVAVLVFILSYFIQKAMN